MKNKENQPLFHISHLDNLIYRAVEKREPEVRIKANSFRLTI